MRLLFRPRFRPGSRPLRLLVTTVSIASLSACGDSIGPGQLALSLQVARTAVRANDSVTVRIEATNTSSRDLTFQGDGAPCGRLFELLKDNQVIPWSGVCTLELRAPFVLKASSAQTMELVWYANLEGWPVLLTPGTYQLRAKARTGADIVTSAPVNIEVLPHQ